MRVLPLLISTLTVWAYWLRVGAMIVRARHRERLDVGVVTERPTERAMWLVFVPIVAAWCTLPYLALTRDDGVLAVPPFARDAAAYPALRWLCALAAVACLALTLRCWRDMGRHWRMDISESNTELVTRGFFARVRHPIYALSIAMMLATAVALPTLPMASIAVIHVALMIVKARNEEAHLARMHGEAYARYVARTGRFLPRPAARRS
jgi:protein-S-isoprenylcysteine O-methyltransferase Ste14